MLKRPTKETNMDIKHSTSKIDGTDVTVENVVIKADYGTLDKAGRMMGCRIEIRPYYRKLETYNYDTKQYDVTLLDFSTDVWRVEVGSMRDGRGFGPCARRPSLVKGTLADAIAHAKKHIAKKSVK